MAVNNAINSGGILTFAAGKTLTVNNTLTLAGTDGTTMTFPSTSATIARTDAANTFTGHQTIEGVTSTGATGTGNFVFDNTPTLITPALGVATATSINTLLLSATASATNILIGTDAGLNASGIQNVFVGNSAGKGTIGSSGANYDTAIGYMALDAINDGDSNTAVGNGDLRSVTDGNDNTGVGQAAGVVISTGNNNTAIGSNALSTNDTGSGNVALGYKAGKYETGSNTLYIDNQDRTNTAGDKANALLYGTFAATAAGQTLMVNGVLSTSVVGTSAGNVAIIDGAQTLTSKTLTTPILSASTSTTSGALGMDTTDHFLTVGDVSTANPIYVNHWKSWTPSWTNLTVGNSTNTGYYCVIGKAVHAHGQLILGNTGSVGTNVTLTLPVAIASTYPSNFTPIGFFRAAVSGVGYIGLIGHTGLLLLTKTDTTYATGANVTATVPATWATNDNIQYSIYYESA